MHVNGSLTSPGIIMTLCGSTIAKIVKRLFLAAYEYTCPSKSVVSATFG